MSETMLLYPCVQTAYSQAECKKCVMVVDRSLVEMGEAGPTLSAAYDEDVFAVKGYPQRMQIVYRQGIADDGDDTKTTRVYQSAFLFSTFNSHDILELNFCSQIAEVQI